MYKKPIVLMALATVGVAVGYTAMKRAPEAPALPSAETAMVKVTLPATLTSEAQLGKAAFEAKCAACHGANGAGNVNAAPPLIHKIYEPSHHGDESFHYAAAMGVQAHHWRFGNMPPVEGITRAEVATIITYIRELQRANGIF